MTLAHLYWYDNDVAAAEKLLDAATPDRRGWEWHYLKRQRCQAVPTLRTRAALWDAAISPDGKSIASSDIIDCVAVPGYIAIP